MNVTFDEIVRQAYLENVDRGDMELLKVIEKVFYNASGDGGGDSEDYSGIAFFDNSATFADVQAAIDDGKLPILKFYIMGSPAYFYCCEHSTVWIDFISFSGMVKYQLRWSNNGNKQLSSTTLVSNQSPQFYGNPTAMTPAENDSSTKLATTSFVNRAVNNAIADIAISGISEPVKQALLQIARKVYYSDDDGQTYYEALYNALYPPINVDSISAVWNPPTGYVVYTTDDLDSLKTYLTVTATYTDQSTDTLDANEYTLSGVLSAGTSIITVTYAGVTTTFNVTVTANIVESISAVFVQGQTVIYNVDDLSELVGMLTVTATYSNGDTETVNYPNYALTGNLTTGTSVITATYENKTDTFNVTVTEYYLSSYSYPDGGLTKINYGVVSPSESTKLALSSDNKRRSFVRTNGNEAPYVYYDSQNNSPYYPIPIPPTATGYTISITPSSQYLGLITCNYNSGTGRYTRVDNIGWVQGGHTQSFTAGTRDYLCVGGKYNSSGGNYSTEPTNVTLTFTE